MLQTSLQNFLVLLKLGVENERGLQQIFYQR